MLTVSKACEKSFEMSAAETKGCFYLKTRKMRSIIELSCASGVIWFRTVLVGHCGRRVLMIV